MASNASAVEWTARVRTRFTDAIVAVLIIGAAVAWTAISGKDLNWDQLNYHLYVGYAFVHDRLAQDFMAANGQSYLNPLSYVPFFWMVSWEWPSLLIAGVLATFHALNVVVAYCICTALLGSSKSEKYQFAILSAALAFLSPVFLMEVGTTFNDLTTSFFVLAAVLAALREPARASMWSPQFVIAGVSFGIACALKLSNIVFAPAFGILILCLHSRLILVIRGGFYFGIGSIVGVMLAHGVWSRKLLHAFGNPEEPTFAALRGSPDIPPSTAMLPQRFLPDSFLDGILMPFRMIDARSWVYIETVAADVRFAAAIFLSIVVGILLFARRIPEFPAGEQGRRIGALIAFFVAATALWIATSSNGRYGISVSILCGPALGALAYLGWQSKGRIVLIVLILVQAIHGCTLSPRWNGEPWTQTWYEAEVPERLKQEAFLYVSVAGNSGSYLAPFLNPNSAFTNPVGQVSFEFEGPGGPRLRALFDRFAGRIRILAPIKAPEDETAIARWTATNDDAISRFGFAIDSTDCATIKTDGPPWELRGANDPRGHDFSNHMRTCALRPRAYEHTEARAHITRIVRAIEAWCPRLFRSNSGVVEGDPESWQVAYAATDTTMTIRGNGRISLSQPRSTAEVGLGTISDWESGIRPNCDQIPTRFRKVYKFD